MDGLIAGLIIGGAVSSWITATVMMLFSDKADDAEQLSVAYSRGCGDCRCKKAFP